MNSLPAQVGTKIGVASLIVAPLLMSAGDLMHPAESWDSRQQVALVASAGTRWYVAHLLLLVGMLLFVPGVLLLSGTVAGRSPRLGYASRVLVLTSVGALSAIFAFEMLLGVTTGSDQGAAVALIDMFNSRVFVALLPGLLAFFVGTGLLVASLASMAGPLRMPALCLGGWCTAHSRRDRHRSRHPQSDRQRADSCCGDRLREGAPKAGAGADAQRRAWRQSAPLTKRKERSHPPCEEDGHAQRPQRPRR